MHNLVVLIDPSEDAAGTPLKGGNMCLNRFCIDEDAAFELSGVVKFKRKFLDRKSKGMKCNYFISNFYSTFFLIHNMNFILQ